MAFPPTPPRLTPGDVLGLGLVLEHNIVLRHQTSMWVDLPFETPMEARVALGLLLEDFLPRIFSLSRRIAFSSPPHPIVFSSSLRAAPASLLFLTFQSPTA